MLILNSLTTAFESYSPTVDRQFPYGTAGFRSIGKDMRHIMHRSGLLAVLRSYVANRQVTGLCITASHNPRQDNGVKLIEPNGGMLCPDFEIYATEFINTPTPLDYFQNLCKTLNVDLTNENIFKGCRIYCGRDTRESSPFLFECVRDAIEVLGAEVFNLGIVTTPQVHFAVQFTNENQLKNPIRLEQYYEFFGTHFSEFLSLCGIKNHSQHLSERLVCDGANGVGANRIEGFSTALKSINVHLEVRNDGQWPEDQLNHNCGTEFTQKEMKVPNHFGPSFYDPMHLRCCSLDGDADRLVYHTTNSKGQLILVDGDKIGALYCKVIAKLLADIIQMCPKAPTHPLKLGSVQTAYANGASTDFYKFLKTDLEKSCGLQQVSFEIACTKTGVKNLHHKAMEYDISIYFESNGHGSVISKCETIQSWAQEKECINTTEFKKLQSYLHIFNQATGDAMADILAVEAGLKYLEMSFTEWIRSYSELPCVQQKIHLPRSVLNTLKPHPEHERTLLQPIELQETIDQLVSQHKSSRAFVRPSGTEDVCRIYVEADTLLNGTKLCNDIKERLNQYATSHH